MYLDVKVWTRTSDALLFLAAHVWYTCADKVDVPKCATPATLNIGRCISGKSKTKPGIPADDVTSPLLFDSGDAGEAPVKCRCGRACTSGQHWCHQHRGYRSKVLFG